MSQVTARGAEVDGALRRFSFSESIAKVQSVRRPPIPTVGFQYVEDAAAIRSTRTHLVSAPHLKLIHLGRFDERLAAHLDGIAVAGDFGARLAEAALESPGAGEVFVAAVGAIQTGQSAGLDRLLSVVEALLDSLSDREKNLLRQHVVDELSIDDLGRLYGAHRATAARWLAAARESLLDRTRANFMASVRVSGEECESVLRLVRSQLDATIRRRIEAMVAGG